PLQPAVDRHLPGPLLQRLAVLAVQLRVGKREGAAGSRERKDCERKQTPHGKSLRRKSERSSTPAFSTASRPPSSRSTNATTPSTCSPSLRQRSIAFSVEAPVVTTSSTTTTWAGEGNPFLPSIHWWVPCPFGCLRA